MDTSTNYNTLIRRAKLLASSDRFRSGVATINATAFSFFSACNEVMDASSSAPMHELAMHLHIALAALATASAEMLFSVRTVYDVNDITGAEQSSRYAQLFDGAADIDCNGPFNETIAAIAEFGTTCLQRPWIELADFAQSQLTPDNINDDNYNAVCDQLFQQIVALDCFTSAAAKLHFILAKVIEINMEN